MSRLSDVILMVITNVTNRLCKTLVLNVILIQLSVSREIQNQSVSRPSLEVLTRIGTVPTLTYNAKLRKIVYSIQ
jgi:hypothetical protein